MVTPILSMRGGQAGRELAKAVAAVLLSAGLHSAVLAQGEPAAGAAAVEQQPIAGDARKAAASRLLAVLRTISQARKQLSAQAPVDQAGLRALDDLEARNDALLKQLSEIADGAQAESQVADIVAQAGAIEAAAKTRRTAGAPSRAGRGEPAGPPIPDDFFKQDRNASGTAASGVPPKDPSASSTAELERRVEILTQLSFQVQRDLSGIRDELGRIALRQTAVEGQPGSPGDSQAVRRMIAALDLRLSAIEGARPSGEADATEDAGSIPAIEEAPPSGEARPDVRIGGDQAQDVLKPDEQARDEQAPDGRGGAIGSAVTAEPDTVEARTVEPWRVVELPGGKLPSGREAAGRAEQLPALDRCAEIGAWIEETGRTLAKTAFFLRLPGSEQLAICKLVGSGNWIAVTAPGANETAHVIVAGGDGQ